jgi:hypothetical protein
VDSRHRIAVGFVSSLAAVLAAGAVLAGAAAARSSHKFTAPVSFQVTLDVNGSYSYNYTGVGVFEKRSITFSTQIPILYDVLMYASGKPPAFLRHASGLQRKLSLGVSGSWSIESGGQNAGDPCSAHGKLASGSTPLVAQGDYGKGDYDLVLQWGAGDNGDPFTYTGTHSGSDPCATQVGPWEDWVGGEVKDEAATFDAAVTIPQRALQQALRGHAPHFAVHLLPHGELRSTDCGTTPSVGVACTQSLNWTGRVVVRKGKKH